MADSVKIKSPPHGRHKADTFIFKTIEAMTASVNITDFSTAQSDKLDLTNLLSGHYDPVHDTPSRILCRSAPRAGIRTSPSIWMVPARAVAQLRSPVC